MNPVAADLQAGIAAFSAGDKDQARACFIRVLKREPRNEDVWLYLSNVMPSVEEALRCIDHLLTLNPHNTKAREAQEVLKIRLLLEESALVRVSEPPISTPARRYLLGEALVEARVITQHQLDHALAEQAKLARKRKPMRLGEILLRLKMVTPTQIEGALATQIENLPGSSQAGYTGQIGAYLVQQGLITRAQLHQGLARQTELKQRGRPALLGDVLVDCGYIQRDRLNRAMVEWQHQFNAAFM